MAGEFIVSRGEYAKRKGPTGTISLSLGLRTKAAAERDGDEEQGGGGGLGDDSEIELVTGGGAELLGTDGVGAGDEGVGGGDAENGGADVGGPEVLLGDHLGGVVADGPVGP